MPKVSVYLSDDLYRRAREHDLPLSAITQEAVSRALRQVALDEWIAHERARPRRSTAVIDTSALVEDVREEFGR